MGQKALCGQPVPYELVEAIRQRAPALAAVEGVIPVKVVFHLTNPPQASTLPAKYRGLLDTSRTFMVGRLVLDTRRQGGGQRYYLACNKKAVEERMPFLAEGSSRVLGWSWYACVTGKSLHYNLDFQQVDGRAVVKVTVGDSGEVGEAAEAAVGGGSGSGSGGGGWGGQGDQQPAAAAGAASRGRGKQQAMITDFFKPLPNA